MGQDNKNQLVARASKSVVEVVASNIETLIAAAPEQNRATNTFGKYVGVGNGTIARIRKADSGNAARISTLEKIARRFHLEVWELLVPGLDLDNRPRLLSPAEADRQNKVARILDELRGNGLPVPLPERQAPEKRQAHRFRRKKP